MFGATSRCRRGSPSRMLILSHSLGTEVNSAQDAKASDNVKDIEEEEEEEETCAGKCKHFLSALIANHQQQSRGSH